MELHSYPEPDPEVMAEAAPCLATCAWYALRVKPRHERKVSDNLAAMGEAVFLPQFRSKRRWSDRYKEILLPLFPGYTFCRTAVRNHWRILLLPSIRGVVSFGRRPAPLDDREVTAIQTIVDSGLPAAPWPSLHCGDTVRLTAGPLRGLDGCIISVRGSQRLVVKVGLLQRSVAVEIARDWVVPAGPSFYQRRLRPAYGRARAAVQGR